MTLRRLALRVVALSALCAPAHSSARAQTMHVSGVVRDTATTAPLPGAVVAVLDSLRQSLGRTISDAAGRYSMVLPATATRLRVVRIGFQPRDIALPARREGSQPIDIWMTKVPTLLLAVSVSDDRLCSADRDRSAALSLWEQARAGLLATVVARETQPARAMLVTYDRVTDLKPGRVLRQTTRADAGSTTRPFVAPDTPRLLAERGYLETEGDVQRFKAPDADVLLDESFAATHCFSVRTSDRNHAGAIGLAFEPARGRDALVDVRGTLWLESGVPALRSLEFRYTGPNMVMASDSARGVLHFRAMANGVVFIDEWKVRLPIYVEQRFPASASSGRVARGADIRTTATPDQLRIVQMSESGGVVLTAHWPDGLRYESPLKALTGIVTEAGSPTPLPGTIVSLEGTVDSVLTDSAGRFTLFPVLPGKYAVRVADTTFFDFARERSDTRDVEIAAGQAVDLHLELPARAASLRQFCGTTEGSSNTATLVGRIVDRVASAPMPRDVHVSASWWHVSATSTSFYAKRDTQSVNVDDRGRFSLCGVPRGRAVLLTASHLRAPFSDTLVTIDLAADIMAIRWSLDVAELAKLVPANPATLRGHVTRSVNGQAVVGAACDEEQRSERR
jgi:hypothetical protein